MRHFVKLCLLALLVFTAPAQANQASDLKLLATADDSKGWQAVGRLNFGSKGFCSGALIGADLVLTAAHCLYEKENGKPVDMSSIEFLAGWRNGRAEAYRGVRSGVVHPRYDYRNDDRVSRVAYDIAVLKLDRPIRLPGLTPFETASRPRKGDEVGVVSYAKDRAEAPSLQEVCHVLAGRPGILMLSCSVNFGSSGAPIFSFRDGAPQIVSVVSSMADMKGKPVSLGVSLGDNLDLLRSRLEAGENMFRVTSPAIRRFGQGAPKSDLGAKFLKP